MDSRTVEFHYLWGAHDHVGDWSSGVARGLAREVGATCIERAATGVAIWWRLGQKHVSIGGSEEGDGRSREESFDGRHRGVVCGYFVPDEVGFDVWVFCYWSVFESCELMFQLVCELWDEDCR